MMKHFRLQGCDTSATLSLSLPLLYTLDVVEFMLLMTKYDIHVQYPLAREGLLT